MLACTWDLNDNLDNSNNKLVGLCGRAVCVKKQNRVVLVIFTKSLIVNAMSRIALNKGRGGTVNEMLKAPTSLSLQR